MVFPGAERVGMEEGLAACDRGHWLLRSRRYASAILSIVMDFNSVSRSLAGAPTFARAC
jgi:hypothetical protein